MAKAASHPAHKEPAHPEPDQASVYLDYGPSLPDAYNQDTIVALIRDPECIFAYWELSGQLVPETFRLRDLKKNETKWMLRAHNLSEKNFFETELARPDNITNVQGSYYLNVQPDTEYQLELALRSNQNHISLVKSNIVRTPRKGRSSAGPSSPE